MAVIFLLPFFSCFFRLVDAGCSFHGSFVSVFSLGFFTWDGVCSNAFLVLAMFLLRMIPIVSRQVLLFSFLGSFSCFMLWVNCYVILFSVESWWFSCWNYEGVVPFFFFFAFLLPRFFLLSRVFYSSIGWGVLFSAGRVGIFFFGKFFQLELHLLRIGFFSVLP